MVMDFNGVYAAVVAVHIREDQMIIAPLLTSEHHTFPMTNVLEVAQMVARGLGVLIANENWKASANGVFVFV